MKTLNVDLDKLSKEGLIAYILIVEEMDEGMDLPLPPEYPKPIPPETTEYPIPEEPEELKQKDEETPSFNV